MPTVTFLRIAAALAAIQGIAHGALLVSYQPGHGAAEVAVVEAMRSAFFDFGGFAPHSYWEMYIGYGLFVALNCLIQAVVLWLLASRWRADPRSARPLVAVFLAANLLYAALVARFFFRLPMWFDLAIAGLLTAVLVWPGAAARAAAPQR